MRHFAGTQSSLSSYTTWIRRHVAGARFDLATSGVQPVPDDELAEFERGPSPSWDDVRVAIAEYNRVPADQVLPALGTRHALWLAYAALLDSRDEVLVETPGFESLSTLARAAGAEVRLFGRDPRSHYALDTGRICASLGARTRAVVLTNLHNPSGVRARPEQLCQLAERLGARGVGLIVDEVYAPFGRLDARGRWDGSARTLHENIVAVGSLTKCFGLGAARIGWLLGPPELVEHARDLLILTTGGLPSAQRALTLRAFSALERLTARTQADAREKRARVEAWLLRRPELEWSMPDDCLFGFAIHRSCPNLTRSLEAGASAHGVLVAPGEFFGMPNAFRLAWSLPSDELPAALSQLDLVLDSLGSEP